MFYGCYAAPLLFLVNSLVAVVSYFSPLACLLVVVGNCPALARIARVAKNNLFVAVVPLSMQNLYANLS